MTHDTPLSGLAEVATDQLAEIHRLRETNAELLEALKAARHALKLALDDTPGWTVVCIEAATNSAKAIAKAEASA